MVYIYRMKSCGKYKDGKELNVLFIADRNHERSVVVLDHFRNFNSI